ncbi:MAG: cob(I)yrinic acid a,c-diamide adenosyltransferase [Geovibrio sp.]|nr:cob(I)yrinic acid a,c-diamide adenosyltransferase [Geovibrio sp.]
MRPKTAELVLTGRSAPASIMELADLITEMKEIKHYFSCGVEAREGIEK